MKNRRTLETRCHELPDTCAVFVTARMRLEFVFIKEQGVGTEKRTGRNLRAEEHIFLKLRQNNSVSEPLLCMHGMVFYCTGTWYLYQRPSRVNVNVPSRENPWVDAR
jgi:hypothetical protein